MHGLAATARKVTYVPSEAAVRTRQSKKKKKKKKKKKIQNNA